MLWLEGRQAGMPSCISSAKGNAILARDKEDKMHGFFLCERCGINLFRGLSFQYASSVCSSGWIPTVSKTLYSYYNSPAMTSWAKHKETIRFLMLSVLTLISIYGDSGMEVNQAWLVEGKDLQNELFKYVCTLTYKLLKDSCDLLGEGQEILSFLLCFQYNGLRLPSIACNVCEILLSYSEQVHISLKLISKEQSPLPACFSSMIRLFWKRYLTD